MNFTDIYKALLGKLLAEDLPHINLDYDIAYPNADFNPSNKKCWLAVDFLPSAIETSSKDKTGKSLSGLMQISVYTRINSSLGGTLSYNLLSLEVVDKITERFRDSVDSVGDFLLETTTPTVSSTLTQGGYYAQIITLKYQGI